MLTVAAIGDPPFGVRVNVEEVMVEESIAWLNVAVTVDAMLTPVRPFVGVTEETAGVGREPVVKDQV